MSCVIVALDLAEMGNLGVEVEEDTLAAGARARSGQDNGSLVF